MGLWPERRNRQTEGYAGHGHIPSPPENPMQLHQRGHAGSVLSPQAGFLAVLSSLLLCFLKSSRCSRGSSNSVDKSVLPQNSQRLGKFTSLCTSRIPDGAWPLATPDLPTILWKTSYLLNYYPQTCWQVDAALWLKNKHRVAVLGKSMTCRPAQQLVHIAVHD